MMTDDVRQQTENHRIAQINQRDDHKPAMRQAVVTWAQVDVPAIESRSRQVFNTTRSFMVVENGATRISSASEWLYGLQHALFYSEL